MESNFSPSRVSAESSNMHEDSAASAWRSNLKNNLIAVSSVETVALLLYCSLLQSKNKQRLSREMCPAHFWKKLFDEIFACEGNCVQTSQELVFKILVGRRSKKLQNSGFYQLRRNTARHCVR